MFPISCARLIFNFSSILSCNFLVTSSSSTDFLEALWKYKSRNKTLLFPQLEPQIINESCAIRLTCHNFKLDEYCLLLLKKSLYIGSVQDQSSAVKILSMSKALLIPRVSIPTEDFSWSPQFLTFALRAFDNCSCQYNIAEWFEKVSGRGSKLITTLWLIGLPQFSIFQKLPHKNLRKIKDSSNDIFPIAFFFCSKTNSHFSQYRQLCEDKNLNDCLFQY